MKFKILFSISFWALLFAVSCKSDEITFDNPSKELRFSKDTLFLDTIYNQVRSETYAVKVYNKEDKDVKIPRIALQGGSASPYRINVDGKAGTEFIDVPLRKKDSLFIFVEIAPVANAKEAIAEDQIVFDNNLGQQKVTLLSVVQDAEFFIQSSNNPNILNSNTVWNSNKAKIIYGDLTVAEGKTLEIQEGTKVYFTKNASLKISKNAKLNVNGSLNKEVLFRGDRNDTRYDTIPLNWKGISFDEGAVLNMNYAKVFGGDTGIELHKSIATIQNTIIHSFQNYGILSINSDLKAQNLVMNSNGQASLGIFKGGTVDLTHCTLANYWDLNSSMPAYSLYATNEYTNKTGVVEQGALSLNIKNSIIYGDKDSSIFFKPTSGQTFNYTINSSLIKYSNKSGFDFDGNPWIVNSIKNEEPKFLTSYISKMNLRVNAESPAKGKANAIFTNQVPKDIVGNTRTATPTIGAYQ